jgi:hypothetical protein
MLRMVEDFVPFAYHAQGMSAVDYILCAAQRNYDFQQIFISSITIQSQAPHIVIMKGNTPSWNFESTVHQVTAEHAHRYQSVSDEGRFFVQSDQGDFYSVTTCITNTNMNTNANTNVHDADFVQLAQIPLIPTDIKKIALVAASLRL